MSQCLTAWSQPVSFYKRRVSEKGRVSAFIAVDSYAHLREYKPEKGDGLRSGIECASGPCPFIVISIYKNV